MPWVRSVGHRPVPDAGMLTAKAQAVLDRLVTAPPIRTPQPLCSCGHFYGGHRIDLKNKVCSNATGSGVCSCRGFDQAAVVIRETRWLVP